MLELGLKPMSSRSQWFLHITWWLADSPGLELKGQELGQDPIQRPGAPHGQHHRQHHGQRHGQHHGQHPRQGQRTPSIRLLLTLFQTLSPPKPPYTCVHTCAHTHACTHTHKHKQHTRNPFFFQTSILLAVPLGKNHLWRLFRKKNTSQCWLKLFLGSVIIIDSHYNLILLDLHIITT